MSRKDYRVIYKQEFSGKDLQDSYIKRNATIGEMEQAIDALYSDPHVYSAHYEELEGKSDGKA